MLETIAQLNQQILELKARVAMMRREQSPQAVKDCDLAKAGTGERVRLSTLFAGKKDLLLVQNMGKRCAYCTMWADGFIGLYPHLANRAAFVLATPDDPATAGEFAKSRGWPFPVVSMHQTTFARDLGFARPDGGISPGVSAFSMDAAGAITRVGVSAEFGPGDDFCATWHFLDLLKDGPADWEPKFRY